MPILQAFQEGREEAVPLIIGSNSDDASVVVSFGVDPAQLVQRLGKARLLVRPFYPGIRDENQLGREVARDAVFTAFARRISYLHSRKAQTWRYYFKHAGIGVAGAGHGVEIPFVMGTAEACGCLGAPATKSDIEVTRRLGDRWLAFARTGTPEGTVAWPADNRQAGLALEIGDEDVARRGFMSARLNAFIVGLNILGKRGALASR